MQFYHYLVPVQRHVQQGVQKNLSSVRLATARMPVLVNTWCVLD